MTIGARAPAAAACSRARSWRTTFSFLRPNDLVWNYVVGNYLKGETPPPFDLLYWNSDGTNLPGPMYCWYLRNTYLENKLRKPGKLTVLRREDRPRRDRRAGLHLRLARGPHRAVAGGLREHAACSSGKRRFVLGASGHIAGVINPPAKNKRSHWIGNDKLAGQTPMPGSPGARSTRAAGGPTGPPGSKPHRAASRSPRPRRPATRKYKAIEPAPGRYVKAKAGLSRRLRSHLVITSRRTPMTQTSSSSPPPAPPSASSAARSPRRPAPELGAT